MTALPVPAAGARTGRHAATAALLLGLVLAAFAEALAGTLLALGRADVIGDTAATPDEFAWLDVAYTAAKIAGFAVAPWLLTRFRPTQAVVLATVTLGVASALAALSTRLELLILLRAIQGVAGGAVLVGGQALLFLAFPRPGQPVLQAVFAAGAVVVPATLAPALQGWIIDSQSWIWVLAAALVTSLAAAGLILFGDPETPPPAEALPFDVVGFGLLGTAAAAAAFALGQGSRWNWFESGRIGFSVLVAVVAFVAFLLQQRRAGPNALLQGAVFGTEPFPFAFMVSLVAGAALFGSALLIPAFAVNILGFTPLAAGQLLLPGAAFFCGGLLIAAVLIQRFDCPVLANVPVGIGLVMAAFFMLSGSTLESSAADLNPALFLRGLGLGFLFLALTMIAFARLPTRQLAYGIAIFNIGRQFGGLFGVAGLQTLIDRQAAANQAVLGANLSPGLASATERLSATTAALMQKGMDLPAAGATARSLLGRAIAQQSTVIAFDTAFFVLALLFVFAAPLLIGLKIAFARAAGRRAARASTLETTP
ncbi:MAG: MFS transporter [Pseudomonadota bacterium]